MDSERVRDFKSRVNVHLLTQFRLSSPIVASANEEEQGYEKRNENNPAYNATNDSVCRRPGRRTRWNAGSGV